MRLGNMVTSASFVISLFIQPISAANPPLKTGMDLKETQKISVKGVKIENFAGQVFIKSKGAGDEIQASLKGSDDLLKKITVKDNDGGNQQFYVAFEKGAPTLRDETKLILTLEMPAAMPLDLTIVGGKGEVGVRETDNTKVNLNGYGDIKLESVKGLESRIDGSGEIIVNMIKGNADLAIRGDGKYTIQQGTIPQLKASIKGTGELLVNADVSDADLHSEGAGNMNLSKVSGKLNQSSAGAGAISIAQFSGSLKNKVKGSGIFEMNCKEGKK